MAKARRVNGTDNGIELPGSTDWKNTDKGFDWVTRKIRCLSHGVNELERVTVGHGSAHNRHERPTVT